MAIKYIVELTDEERHRLPEIVSKNKASRYTIVNAYILLKSDFACGWTYEEVAKAYDTPRKKWHASENVLLKKVWSARARNPVTNAHRRKITGKEEAHLIALCCSQAPAGYGTWILRMLAEKMVAWDIVESVSHGMIRRT